VKDCDRWFRPARPSSPVHNLLKTLAQIAAFWGFFLWLVPSGILAVQNMLGIETFQPGIFRAIAWFGFGIAGSVGLYCAFLFVVHGRGTPLPLDQTTRLIVLGPYRWVRNPMAICGLFQGVMVGIVLGSWPVVAYALLGGPAWHILARPAEERDLARRIGAEYTAYRSSVRNWIPCLRPYPMVCEGQKSLNHPSAPETRDSPESFQ